jgi:PAS domain S-box-containing protein
MNETSVIRPDSAESASSLDIDELPLPFVEIDARGVITRANHAARALHHPEQGELVGMTGWTLMAMDEKDFSSAAFHSQMASGEEPPVMYRSIFDCSGRFRTYEFHRSLMRDSEGRPAGMRLVFADVTESKKAFDDARHEQHWLESALSSLPDAVILTDILGVVRFVNPAAEELSGFAANELAGKVIDEAMPMLAYEPLDGTALDRRAAIERRCRGIATLRSRNGKEVKVEMKTSPIIDGQSSSISGVAAIIRKLDGGS